MRLAVPLDCNCSDCKKPFLRYRNRGSMTICTPCQRAARVRAWKAAHPERARAINAKSREANRDNDRASKRKWQIANRAIEAAKQAKRRAAKLQATPQWADEGVTKSLYQLARIYTDAFNEEFHVDHIFPLQSDTVCGLHWHGNLQILTGTENRMKSNRTEGNP